MQPNGVQSSQKQMPTTLYSRQSGESTEDVMLPVSRATLGPHASRMLSAKGLSFTGDIDEQTAVIIQAQYVWPGQNR
ncbi:hypothetical protein SAMN04490208_1196 [Pseudomonas poae]|uniref:Uncharacterized protein n=1 Tax=Pseudomonas poae TaxID=200451 RepID=A0ABY0RDV3_9PSED|nr:hypothetical protein SAMN04490208_1196 [Pseudomonas poae]